MLLTSSSIVFLDGKPSSALQWTDARKEALKEIAKGQKIVWHLDLGLFDRLPKPLESSDQFMTLSLALDHFKETLWSEFYRYSNGLLLYRGTSDFKGEIETRDQYADFLQQLSVRVPEEIPLWIQFLEHGKNPLLTLLAHDPSLYGRFQIDSDAEHLWGCDRIEKEALLMPSIEIKEEAKLLPFLKFCTQRGSPIKKIPECFLINCWEGLDRLYFSDETLTTTGRRQLQGFIAAGGDAVSL